VFMPVTIEYAVMVCEEEELVTCGQRLGDGDIPCPCRSAVCLQCHVFDIAVVYGVPERACVIHNVDAREGRRLVTHAVEQPKQALQVPPGANMARNDQSARHGRRTLRLNARRRPPEASQHVGILRDRDRVRDRRCPYSFQLVLMNRER